MALTDLTGTTWVFNDEPNIESDLFLYKNYQLSFISNNKTFINILYYGADINSYLQYSDVESINVYAYNFDSGYSIGWTDNAYKTISITGGTDATNTDLITWLEANATQQGGSGGINNLKFGTETPTKLYLGATEVTKAYMGETLVYETSQQDELAGTWVLNDTIDYTSFVKVTGATAIEFNFTSNGNTYFGITTDEKPNGLKYIITTGTGDVEPVYVASTNTWTNEAYKTITITSKLSEVTNGNELLAWLQENATKQ